MRTDRWGGQREGERVGEMGSWRLDVGTGWGDRCVHRRVGKEEMERASEWRV